MKLDQVFQNALHYEAYRKHVDDLVNEGKTTGDTQNEMLFGFTKLNIQRMNRLDKTIQLDEQTIQFLKQINQKKLWLLIGDAWCGDCAQIIPIMNKMAEQNLQHIDFRIISRDSFSGLIEKFNSNGSKSIPKLLILNADNFEVQQNWGPRPEGAHQILLKWKSNQDTMSHDDFEKELHLWYAKDKGLSTIKELQQII